MNTGPDINKNELKYDDDDDDDDDGDDDDDDDDDDEDIHLTSKKHDRATYT